MKAIVVEKHGGPEVLRYKQIASPNPGYGEVKIRNYAVGLNFTDIYFREGVYKPPSLPFVPGNEGAGEVIAVGAGVKGISPGDRVAYVMVLGAYAQESIVPAHYVVSLPDSMQYETAAAIMLKGLTAEYLLHRTFRVRAGHIVLIYAAAGGVGSLLTQWAKHLGAIVIGVAGSEKKALVASRNGCDYVINYTKESVSERVKEITDGQGCHVVYDGVGRDTLTASLNSLRPLGYFVSFGSASGALGPVDPGMLAQNGSLFMTSPILFDYIQPRQVFLGASKRLFEAIATKALHISAPAQLPLADAAYAQQLLASRQTVGTTILVP